MVRPDGTTCHYAITVARAAATIAEAPAPDAGARISGSETDWIDALGPAADRDQLAISGDKRLARVVLDGVGATALRATRAA